jgi:hypothetical protein
MVTIQWRNVRKKMMKMVGLLMRWKRYDRIWHKTGIAFDRKEDSHCSLAKKERRKDLKS